MSLCSVDEQKPASVNMHFAAEGKCTKKKQNVGSKPMVQTM